MSRAAGAQPNRFIIYFLWRNARQRSQRVAYISSAANCCKAVERTAAACVASSVAGTVGHPHTVPIPTRSAANSIREAARSDVHRLLRPERWQSWLRYGDILLSIESGHRVRVAAARQPRFHGVGWGCQR